VTAPIAATAPLPAGLHADVSFARYLADPCAEPSLSSSTIRDMLRSPLHAYQGHPRLGGGWGDESSRANLGTAIHARVLGGEERIAWIDAANWRTAAAKGARAAAYAFGRVPMLVGERRVVEGAAKAALTMLDAAGFAIALAEQTVIWQEGDTWCRARPDLIAAGGPVIDLKTAENADPSDWIRRSMIAGGYHVQAAWYLRGVQAVAPLDREREFICLVVELEPPHGCSLVGVRGELLEVGRAVVECGLARWRECHASGVWPGYKHGVHWASAPAWLQYEMADRGIAVAAAPDAGALEER